MPYTVEQIKNHIQKLRSMSDLKPEDFAEEDGLADSLVQELKRLRRDLKPTQMRKVFHAIKDMRRKVERQQEFDRTELALIMPMLAYAVGRDLLPRDFYDVLKLCLGSERLRSREDFLRAADFIEAVMAYHKYRN